MDAFRSTLEEAKYADIILHVVDASSPQMEMQMHVVYETLKNLGVEGKEIITVFNKMDRFDRSKVLKDFKADRSVCLSAKTGEGIPVLKEEISALLKARKLYVEKCYAYGDAGKIQTIRKYGQLLKEEYREDGIWIEAYVPKEIFGQI